MAGYDNGYNPKVNINERLPNDAPYEEIKKPDGYGQRTLGHARRISDGVPFPLSPIHYPWRATGAALAAMREAGESNSYDSILLMLASPVDGGSTLPTIAWQAHISSARQTHQPH